MTTKSPLKPLLPELQHATEQARERIAAEQLSLELVRDRIFGAAKEGHTSWRFRLPDCPDVRNTRHVADFEKWARTEGLRVEWLKRIATTPDGREVTVLEPEISWHPEPKRKIAQS